MPFELVSWNMQRGNLTDDRIVAKVREAYLAHLVDRFGVVFLQEAPKAIHEAHSFQGKAVFTSPYTDTQHEANPCRSAIITGAPAQTKSDSHISGGEGFRYPATVELDQDVGGVKIFMSSFHCTSSN